MHGGTSRGPVTKMGKERSRKAALRHGGYTKLSQRQDREVKNIIRISKNFLNKLNI